MVRRNRSAALIVALGCLVALTATVGLAQIGMGESGLRLSATHKPLPTYPAASIAKGTSGVSVATVVSGPEGNVTSVTILEAPDEAIGEAVRAALLAWKIPPVTRVGRSGASGLRAKVTFYFRITGGRGRVFHPEQMPGAPKPQQPSGSVAAGAARPPSLADHGGGSDSEIDEAAFARMSASKPILIDIRERDDFRRQHRPGAINIPGNELEIRGPIELESARPVVIDCTFTETRLCHNAAGRLRPVPKLGKVFVLLP